MALVIATKRGYYKKIREPGDKFEYPLKQGEETGSWMERVGKAASDKANEAAVTAEEVAKKAEAEKAAAEDKAEKANQQAAELADAAKVAEDEAGDELDLDLNDEPIDAGVNESTEGSDPF